MALVARSGWMPIFLVLASNAMAQHHHSAGFVSYHTSSHVVVGGAGGGGHHAQGGMGPVMGGGGFVGGGGGGAVGFGGGLGFPVGAVGGGGFGFGGFGVGVFNPVPVFVNPQFGFPMFGNQGFGMNNGGLNLPMPPVGLGTNPARPRRPNPERARELVEIGDRSFRGGNIHRAEERYILASKADPSSPSPLIHLAQVSMVRKDYAKAANQIRQAVAAARGAGWLTNAPDIQTMYAEPGDFARQLAKLESHLQTSPGDRDGWFLLGVELYLSGRTQQASDAFQRLTDRRADEALAAFIDASKPRPVGVN